MQIVMVKTVTARIRMATIQEAEVTPKVRVEAEIPDNVEVTGLFEISGARIGVSTAMLGWPWARIHAEFSTT
jgi:hypothetical protein